MVKYALAFATLAAAANNQAPVISLDLAAGAYPTTGGRVPTSAMTTKMHAKTAATSSKGNAFADECAVSQNGLEACVEPIATAYDHHDGDITGDVVTTYHLFVKSEVRQNPVHVSQNKTSMNLSLRGEWIIEYNVEDADGNDAETVTFALILTDEIAPACKSETPNCTTQPGCTGGSKKTNETDEQACSGKNYRKSTKGSNTLEIELCGDGEDKYYIDTATTEDLYDGDLTESNSRFQTRLYNGAEKPEYTTKIPKAWFKGKSADVSLKYEIESHDFADIFGASNKNNVRLEKGDITIKDTIKPTIVGSLPGQKWQCGFCAPKSTYRKETADAYNDCYDNWANTKNDVSIKITGVYKNSNTGGYSTYTKKAIDGGKFGSALSNEADAILGCKSIGAGNFTVAGVATTENTWVSHSKPQHVSITYNVADKFGNKADELVTSIEIVDTIAPTLYITQAEAVAHTHVMANGDKCEKVDAKWSNTNMGDKTTEHCKWTVAKDYEGTDKEVTYSKYTHKATATSSTTNSHLVHNANPMTDETIIQHSAGYAEDYKFVQELMVENVGYACYDACSSTTTTVAWVASCTKGASTGTEFNMLKPGTYYLKYTCKDEADKSTTACRTFRNVDKTRPVITCLECANHADGTWHVEASRDNNYVDAGATCSDMVDGNISQDVEVSGDVVNMAATGTYKINYNCEDSAGQTAYPATRTVIVEDKTCPTCTIPGSTDTITVEASFPYHEEVSTCTDTLDGAIPNATVYGTVNVETTGTYVMTYSVTDVAGNGADPTKCGSVNKNHRSGTHFTKTVIVEDTMVPIISLKYRGSKLMAESTTSTVNGWVIGAVASAVSGVALLGYAATRKAAVATSVPV